MQRVQLTGLSLNSNSCAELVDVDGNTTITTVSLNPGAVSKVLASINTTLGITNVSHSIAGYEVCLTNSLGGVTEHLYDGFSRRVKTTNYANGHELEGVTTYHDDGSVASVGEVTANGTNTTNYSTRQAVPGEPDAYKITVTDSQSNQTENDYSGDGQLYRSDGATYPTETTRDATGRMSQLHTWRDENGDSDITRWYYDLFTGAVTNKLYADGNGTAYTYLSDGRIASREWARDVTTTYGYLDTSTGRIKTTEYTDDTPNVTNTYNLAGQLLKVAAGDGATSFGYDSKGRQIAETNSLAVITRSYDAYGRYSQFVLDPAYTGYPNLIINYGYDVFNRLSTITAIVGTETNLFSYSYLSGTQLISGYTASMGGTAASLFVTRSYEPYRNLISSITNSWNSIVLSSFNYISDSIGRRTKRADYFNTSTITNDFTYNIRSEVKGATMNGNTYGYDYDSIGNRNWSAVNAVTNTYSANQLNQYSSISDGTSITPTYDEDGSLAYDGYKWHHTWNAESRLISSSNDVTGVYITYDYDYNNRRISKTTLAPNPYSSLTSKYIWDGFNIAAEIIIDHVTPSTNISYYTWGIDLSGTLQGAGGVGGLLSDTKVDANGINTFCSLSDANGNISEYVDDTGAVQAHYEYSATGEEVYSSGAMKDDFTHRFSTKPFDEETGLVVYQRRYYNSKMGRWLSRDPIEEAGGLNIYGIAGNDLINKWDYLGLVGRVSVPNFKDISSGVLRKWLATFFWHPPDEWKNQEEECLPCKKVVWTQDWDRYYDWLGIACHTGLDHDWGVQEASKFGHPWTAGGRLRLARLDDSPGLQDITCFRSRGIRSFAFYLISNALCIEGDDKGEIYATVYWKVSWDRTSDKIIAYYGIED